MGRRPRLRPARRSPRLQRLVDACLGAKDRGDADDQNGKPSPMGRRSPPRSYREVSGVRAGDIDRVAWQWTVRRQTTALPGGLVDKGTKGKRARTVPIIEELHEMVSRRMDRAPDSDSRLFTGPRGGRITTAVLRDATQWDRVVQDVGYPHLRRHDLRHTGLTWLADAGVPVHVLRKIAGHGSLTTTQRYLHPDRQSDPRRRSGAQRPLDRPRSPSGPQLRAV